jgi:hypothetical protein
MFVVLRFDEHGVFEDVVGVFTTLEKAEMEITKQMLDKPRYERQFKIIERKLDE